MAQEKGLVTSITKDGWAQVETDRNEIEMMRVLTAVHAMSRLDAIPS